MPYSVIIHLSGEDAVAGEIDELPAITQTLIRVSNPHRVDGKELHYLAENVNTVYWPTTRITFIEMMTTREEEQIIGFVRE
jgi:hypothetical protein